MAANPPDQASRLGLWVRRKLAATIHIHHHHCYYYTALFHHKIVAKKQNRIFTQPVGWYSFQRPAKGGRLSRPKTSIDNGGRRAPGNSGEPVNTSSDTLTADVGSWTQTGVYACNYVASRSLMASLSDNKIIHSAVRATAASRLVHSTRTELNWPATSRPSYATRLRASASRLDWLPRNWDGWCSNSWCPVNTPSETHVFRTPVRGLEFSSHFLCCEQIFVQYAGRVCMCLTVLHQGFVTGYHQRRNNCNHVYMALFINVWSVI